MGAKHVLHPPIPMENARHILLRGEVSAHLSREPREVHQSLQSPISKENTVTFSSEVGLAYISPSLQLTPAFFTGEGHCPCQLILRGVKFCTPKNYVSRATVPLALHAMAVLLKYRPK